MVVLSIFMQQVPPPPLFFVVVVAVNLGSSEYSYAGLLIMDERQQQVCS